MHLDLKIAPRFVKQDKDGLRPFQKEALDAIKNSTARLIFLVAPVRTWVIYHFFITYNINVYDNLCIRSFI